MAETVVRFLSSQPWLFALLSVGNSLVVTAAITLTAVLLFKNGIRKNKLALFGAGLVCLLIGILRLLAYTGTLNEKLWADIQLLYPFLCLGILFERKKLLKACIVGIGFNIVDVFEYLILISLGQYDFATRNDALELLIELALDSVVLAVATAFFLIKRGKNDSLSQVSVSIPLFALIVFTLCYFVYTIILLGINRYREQKYEFYATLFNIPLFSVTLIWAVSSILKSRMREESYRHILDLQIEQYRTTERKNEELKIFRHDMPKKIQPMILYMQEGKTELALEIAQEFDRSIEMLRPRYNTGNVCLDTVLECQQQNAEKCGAKIVFPFGGCFPESGISPNDIYTIFPNALSNAIEARSQVEGERTITVTSRIVSDTVFVTIENPISGGLNIKNGEIMTSKSDKAHHGFGMKSIKRAAANYGSDNVEYRVENGRFMLILELKFAGI